VIVPLLITKDGKHCGFSAMIVGTALGVQLDKLLSP